MGRPVIQPLDVERLRIGCEALAAMDPRLGRLYARNGTPPLRLRPPGLATLVHLILQQQVSRASASAVFDRLEATVGRPVVARALLETEPEVLRRIGFSYQKIEYVREIAAAVESGTFDLAGLADLEDEAAIDTLLTRRGVGPWTAAVYVLTALGRQDVWAPGDRALLVSLGRMLHSDEVPTSAAATTLAASWSPWRAVAARLLWHDYAATELR
jgi:DNA-3-methyladenine glycosylase II